MKKRVKILKHVLIIFVLVSIGFALGKHSVAKQSSSKLNSEKTSLIRVYYMHGNLRCVTCNSIQEMTEKLLKDKYSKAIAEGKIEFVEVNFQKNEALAKRFDISFSCVVTAKIQAGKIVAYQRLEKVWKLFKKPAEFNSYISKAIQAYQSPQEEAK